MLSAPASTSSSSKCQVCLVGKEDGDYLLEWIISHRLLCLQCVLNYYFSDIWTMLRQAFYIENVCLRVYAAWIRPTEDDEADSLLGCVFVLQTNTCYKHVINLYTYIYMHISTIFLFSPTFLNVNLRTVMYANTYLHAVDILTISLLCSLLRQIRSKSTWWIILAGFYLLPQTIPSTPMHLFF